MSRKCMTRIAQDNGERSRPETQRYESCVFADNTQKYDFWNRLLVAPDDVKEAFFGQGFFGAMICVHCCIALSAIYLSVKSART